jgi:hypothetical protein
VIRTLDQVARVVVRKAGRPIGWLLCAVIACAPVNAQDWQIVVPLEPDFLMDVPLQRLQNVADVPLDMTLLEIVRQLDAPDFHEREQAAQQIIERADDKIKLYAILDHGDLTVEQRYRLLQVVREYLLEMPRGAVGISMDGWQPGMALQGGGVRVADLVPGMPAERVLQVGDRIVAIDGHPLATQNDLIIYVQNKRPGDKVNMSIKRSKTDERGNLVVDDRNQPIAEDLVLELELGSVEMLRNARRGDVRTSPVAQQRAREAGEVADKFAPTPTPVMVRGENGKAFAFTLPEPGDVDAESGDSRVDTHPMVLKLMRDFEMIDAGRITLTPELRRQWFQDLQIFANFTAQQDMDEDSRLVNELVIARYSQLLNNRLQKVMPTP